MADALDDLDEIDSGIEVQDSDGEVQDTIDDASSPQERSRLQSSIFQSWVVKKAAAGLQKGSNGPQTKLSKSHLSIAEIIGQLESQQIIKNPRDYQLELFERAKVENTIAVLDTGTGKTLIAVLLLRHIIDQELEDRQNGKSHRVAFFLVPSVNLVFQQHAVLESNLDHAIAKVYGAMHVDLWTKSKWLAVFNDHKVIVCTAEILHKCLGHGFIRIDQINLLIFDEAHHAKLQHPYCKIIRDHYALADEKARPRIFGLTASPVDIKADGEDVLEAATGLESTLFSKIATAKDFLALQNCVHRPQEKQKSYSRIPAPSATVFAIKIQSQYGHFGFVQKLANRAADINAKLGSWCADMYWRLVLPDQIESKSNTRLERMADMNVEDTSNALKDQQLEELKQLLSFVNSDTAPAASKTTSAISQKVFALLDILMDFFGRDNDCRCIVFVEQRYVAKLLAQLLQTLDEGFVQAAALVGTTPNDYLGASSTFREQVLTLLKFRRGEVNCLFATSVAEEGLDVPDCNLIIRFDPCKTMIQYIQSRGRARHHNSHFVHMVENGNQDHGMLLEDNAQAERQMRRFCQCLPEDRYLVDDEDLFNTTADAGIKPYEIAETGAKLTASNCIPILAQFCSSLDDKDGESLRPMYLVQHTTGGFVCEIIMPTASPIRGMLGKVKRRKIQAKFSAAYQVCAELIREHHLDTNMLPVFDKRAKLMANAKLSANMYGKKSGFAVRHKPDYGIDGSASAITRLFAIRIDFSTALERPHQPMVLFFRKDLGEHPGFPIYPDGRTATSVRLIPASESFEVNEAIVDLLTRFTLVIFKDVFAKTYEFDPASMSYWVAPTIPSDTAAGFTLDWAAMRYACEGEDLRWSPTMEFEDLIGRFLVDPFDGGKRYFSRQVAKNLKPSHRNPLPPSKRQGDTIFHTSTGLYRKQKRNATWDEDQPVLLVEEATAERNFLAQFERPENMECYVCPQILRMSRLSPEFAATAFALPSIIHRFESHLITLEGCRALGLDIHSSLALEAFTKDSDGAAEHEMENGRVNFQRGMGRNYERLELYGDTFLKMASTIATYIQNPLDSEYKYHVKRMLQICNSNLYDVAVRKGLPQYIRAEAMSRRAWYPAGMKLIEGKGRKKADNPPPAQLGKKTIADVSEAIIGAALCSHNVPESWTPESWTNAIRAVTMLVDNEVHGMNEWDDYRKAYIIPKWQTKPPRAFEVDLAEKVSREHNYSFRNPRLVHAVFTHPSMPMSYEDVKSYEQLEFLGDALLDMAIVSHLFYRFPDKDPGWLTEHKMAMASNKFFAALCVKLGFQRHLRHNTALLRGQIETYRLEVEEAEAKSQGSMDYWTEIKDPPKALADVLEAYVGALFLDSDFDYNEVQRFFDTHIIPFFENMDLYDTYTSGHPVTKLHKLLQISFGCRDFRLMVQEMPTNDDGTDEAMAGVVVHREVVGGDHSQSGRYAKMRAASKAFKELEGMPLSAFRTRFGCDCRPVEGDREVEKMAVDEDIMKA